MQFLALCFAINMVFVKVLFDRFTTLVALYQRMFPKLQVDVDAELKRYEKYAEEIRPFVTETVSYINKILKEGKQVLVEGANAAMLDIDFGNYIKFYINKNLHSL